MLVLSRELEQSVIITTPAGEKISVKIIRVAGCKVRLGFEAQKNIKILREEIVNLLPQKHEG